MLRRSGRTSRMLALAKKASIDGYPVIVIAANAAHAQTLRRLLPCDSRIRVYAPSEAKFNWDSISIDGCHPSTQYFVDHYAIESHFNCILHELHRYDR